MEDRPATEQLSASPAERQTPSSTTPSANVPVLRTQTEFLMTGIASMPAQAESECTTCLEPLGDDVVKVLRCGHMFHCTFILLWFQSNSPRSNACPNCRTELFAAAPPGGRREVTPLRNSQAEQYGLDRMLEMLREDGARRRPVQAPLHQFAGARAVAPGNFSFTQSQYAPLQHSSQQAQPMDTPVPAMFPTLRWVPNTAGYGAVASESQLDQQGLDSLRISSLEYLLCRTDMPPRQRRDCEQELARRRAEVVQGGSTSQQAPTANRPRPSGSLGPPDPFNHRDFSLPQSRVSSRNGAVNPQPLLNLPIRQRTNVHSLSGTTDHQHQE